MNVRVNLRHVLGAGAVLFAVAALYISVLIDRRQDELSKASRYDLSWTAAQTVVEIARLGQAIGAYAASPGLTSDREVQMRYDLLVSRVSMFDSLEFRALAHEDPTSGRVIGTLRRSVPELGPLVDNLDEHANVAEALRVLTGLTSEAAALASAANQRGGTNAYESQRSLLHLHWLFSGLTFSLVGAGVVLLFSLARQNRTLVPNPRGCAPRQSSRRNRQPGEDRLPRLHEPRNSYSAERHHGLHRPRPRSQGSRCRAAQAGGPHPDFEPRASHGRQRRPRFLENRGGRDRPRPEAVLARSAHLELHLDRARARSAEGSRTHRARRSRRPALRPRRRAENAADPAQPLEQRHQVHARRQRDTPRRSRGQAGAANG